MTPRTSIAPVAAFVAFILIMAGLQIPDWSIVGEVTVAMTEVPLIRFVFAVGVLGFGAKLLGRRRV